MKNVFKFDLGQIVKIKILEEAGEIYARTEWLNCSPSYSIRYKSKEGNLAEKSFYEADLSSVSE